MNSHEYQKHLAADAVGAQPQRDNKQQNKRDKNKRLADSFAFSGPRHGESLW